MFWNNRKKNLYLLHGKKNFTFLSTCQEIFFKNHFFWKIWFRNCSKGIIDVKPYLTCLASSLQILNYNISRTTVKISGLEKTYQIYLHLSMDVIMKIRPLKNWKVVLVAKLWEVDYTWAELILLLVRFFSINKGSFKYYISIFWTISQRTTHPPCK